MKITDIPRKVVRRILGRSTADKRQNKMFRLMPKGSPEGHALISYILDPFTTNKISNDHTHFWESWHIAQSLLEKGIAVDVISYLDNRFQAEVPYTHFISARTNFQRIASQLPATCKKVVHLDTAHWLYNNTSAMQRLLDLQNRRGVTLHNIKMVEANWALEHADLGTVLGNQFTIDTYKYAQKPLHRIPISAPTVYEWDESKSFDACRNKFMWFGSSGFVHKGLDLVIEAFAQMPDKELYVCGPFDQESEFIATYKNELYNCDNIHPVGWVDVDGEQFKQIARDCIGLVYPSCSEGGGGSAITCMHAGLIPIVSVQTSVDVGDGGTLLAQNTIEEICREVNILSDEPATALEQRARASWETARQNHTRDSFADHFNAFRDSVLL